MPPRVGSVILLISCAAGLGLAWSGQANAKTRRSKSKPPPPRAAAADEDAEAQPETGQGLLFSAALGAGSAPGGAMVVFAGAAAYRWPWEGRFVDLHGSYVGGLSGGSLDHLLLASVRLGAPLGTTGLVGWAGGGYRLAALAMPYGPSHVYNGLALEGALQLDPRPDVRLEIGIELDYPSSGPEGASFVLGVGAHAQALVRFGELGLYGRYELIDFHSKLAGGSLDDLVHSVSLGLRSPVW